LDQSEMVHEEKGSFSGANREIAVKISRSEEIVQDGAGIAEVDTEDVTQDSETTSEFSGAESRVLSVVETEQDSLEEGVGIEVSEDTLELGDGGGKLVEVTIEKVVVVVDESQIVGNNESEASQINISEVSFSESGQLPSEGDGLSTGGFTGKEVNEGRVSLGEADGGKLTIGGEITLSEESVGNNVLVILTLDNVTEIVLAQHTSGFGFEEVLDIDAKAS